MGVLRLIFPQNALFISLSKLFIGLSKVIIALCIGTLSILLVFGLLVFGFITTVGIEGRSLEGILSLFENHSKEFSTETITLKKIDEALIPATNGRLFSNWQSLGNERYRFLLNIQPGNNQAPTVEQALEILNSRYSIYQIKVEADSGDREPGIVVELPLSGYELKTGWVKEIYNINYSFPTPHTAEPIHSMTNCLRSDSDSKGPECERINLARNKCHAGGATFACEEYTETILEQSDYYRYLNELGQICREGQYYVCSRVIKFFEAKADYESAKSWKDNGCIEQTLSGTVNLCFF